MGHRISSSARLALAGAVLLSTGCVMYQGDRRPNLVASGRKPTLSAAPRIDVILKHRHTFDGQASPGTSAEATLDTARKSWERVRETTAFLANASVGAADPEYVLTLDTENAEKGRVWAMISGYSMMLIPGFPSVDFVVDATLETPEGTVVSKRQAVGTLKVISHLLFVPIFPVAIAMAPGNELYDDTFRDVVLLLETDLKKRSR